MDELIDIKTFSIMLQKLSTISNSIDKRLDQNDNQGQITPYNSYLQLRQQYKKEQLSCSNPNVLFYLTRGILARLLLILVLIYLYLTAYCISDRNNNIFIWLLSFLSLLIVIEGIISIWYHNGKHEWFWFSPCIFLFVLIGLPPIWFIRYHEWSIIASEHSLTSTSSIPDLVEDLISNNNSITTCHRFKMFLEQHSGISFGEQLLTISIVFVRWLLPIRYNEHLNRFVYLEMLLFNVAIVSDIFEFTESILTKTNEEVLISDRLKIISMISYSLSLFLFTINLKAKKKHRSCKLKYILWSYANIYQRLEIIIDFLLSTETWSCLIVLFILDIPFLIFRLIVLFVYNEYDFKMIFFIVKNLMIILIDIKVIYGYIYEYKFQRSQYDHQIQITI